MTAPRHLLLDFGGVCLLTPVELHAGVERSLGLEPGAIAWKGPFDPEGDPLWRRMLAGEVTERGYWAQRARELGEASGRGSDWTTRDYMHVCYALPEETLVRKGALSIVADAKAAGRKVGVLTNDLEAFHGPEWVASITFLEGMDSLTDASITRILKPDPRAYQQALSDLGVSADEVVFADDQPGNVKGAEAFGIDAVWFDVRNPEKSWAEARERMGLPPAR